MAPFLFRTPRKVKARRRKGAAPALPGPVGLSIPARRVNRIVAGVALLGAFGTVALAVALTPGAQTSPMPAKAFPVELALSEPEAPAAATERASPPTAPAPAVAALSERAPKADRLVPRWQTRSAAAAPLPDRQPLRGSVQEPPVEREFAPAVEKRDTRGDLIIVAKPDLESEIERVSSEPPAPSGVSADSADRATAEPTAAALAATGSEIISDAGAEDIAGAAAAAIAGSDKEAAARVTQSAAPEAAEEPAVEVTEFAVAGVEDEAPVKVMAERAAELTRQASLQPSDEALPTPAPKPEVKFRLAPVTSDVNMRAKPKNGSKVITVVPRRSQVQVIGCDYWCEVIYEGKRGWIYKSFIRRTKS